MAHTTQNVAPMQPMHTHTIAPAQLWIGNHETTLNNAINYLQTIFCRNNGCGSCTTCHAIRTQQFYAVTWLMPEKQYTVEDLAVIGSTLVFALEKDQHHFFVLQKSELLTQVTANSLLKSIEEPPAGYHFLLLTQRPQEILPTIRSRCVEQQSGIETDAIEHHMLFSFFTSSMAENPATFLKELDRTKINEKQSVELFDQIFAYWIRTSKKAITDDNQQAYTRARTIIAVLSSYIKKLPMSGSSALFWKDLFLAMPPATPTKTQASRYSE